MESEFELATETDDARFVHHWPVVSFIGRLLSHHLLIDGWTTGHSEIRKIVDIRYSILRIRAGGEAAGLSHEYIIVSIPVG